MIKFSPRLHFDPDLSNVSWVPVVPMALSGVLGIAGCSAAGGDAPAPAQRQAPLIGANGSTLQGMSLQGISLQGVSLQGMSLQGTSLQGTSLQGTSLQGTSLQGMQLVGTDSAGAQFTLHIAAVQTDAQDASGEITLYALEAWNVGTGTWENVCSPDPWGERWAIPVSGSWDATGAHIGDPSVVTFACTSGVIAKCVRWGYKPWKSVNGESLAPYHQACTRMARADYCGDGVPHTLDGTLIDVYDRLGVQTRTEGVNDMYFEATWSPNGAECLAKQRWENLVVTETVADRCNRKVEAVTNAPLSEGESCHMKLQPSDPSMVLLRNRSRVNTL
jgi:hypothetical protein